MPRIGLWVPWADTDMMGWIRYIFDRDAIPYTYLRDEDLRAGGLKDNVDVIVYGPFSRLELAGQIHGIAATDGPVPFRSTPEFPSLGKPVESDDITGGPGYAGLAELQKFVESGGVLLTLGTGTTLALEGGLVPRCAAGFRLARVYAGRSTAHNFHATRPSHRIRLRALKRRCFAPTCRYTKRHAAG